MSYWRISGGTTWHSHRSWRKVGRKVVKTEIFIDGVCSATSNCLMTPLIKNHRPAKKAQSWIKVSTAVADGSSSAVQRSQASRKCNKFGPFSPCFIINVTASATTRALTSSPASRSYRTLLPLVVAAGSFACHSFIWLLIKKIEFKFELIFIFLLFSIFNFDFDFFLNFWILIV